MKFKVGDSLECFIDTDTFIKMGFTKGVVYEIVGQDMLYGDRHYYIRNDEGKTHMHVEEDELLKFFKVVDGTLVKGSDEAFDHAMDLLR